MSKSKHTVQRGTPPPILATVAERSAKGRGQRKQCPRSAVAGVESRPEEKKLDSILRKDSVGRLADLVPIRYGRMLASPFAFFRGAVAVMMEDIGRLPHSGIATQLCGDCHVRNFGGFASPERSLVFGINDYDQTLQGPFEWDVKRLAASVMTASREVGMSEGNAIDAATAVARSYRTHMARFSRMDTLDLWYARIEATELVRMAGAAKTRKKRQTLIDKAARHTSEKTFAKLVRVNDGVPRIKDTPPLIYHLPDVRHFEKEVRDFYSRYLATLPTERRTLLDWYALVDVAAKVTGVGSVGLRCAVALLMAGADDPLFLQLKEARPSVLAPYAGAKRQSNQGLRVVMGQHLMQSTSDPFLGWFRSPELKRDFYVRQFNDMKFSLDSHDFTPEDFADYADICGWELARGHAKAGDPALIAGYLGDSDAFDRAIARFAVAYADRTEKDYQQFASAVKGGSIRATIEHENGCRPRSPASVSSRKKGSQVASSPR